MPFNGSGTYTPPGASFPAVTLTTISSTKYNAVVNDMASALSNVICKDGQTTLTANIPMNSKKLTGLAAGSAAGDSLRFEQLFVNSIVTLLGGLVVGSLGGVLQAPAGTALAPGIRLDDAGSGIFGNGDFTTRFSFNQAEAARVIATGVYVTGGGLSFPAVQLPNADPNTLDDYEEGTWTPVVAFGGASVGITYGNQTGTYTKIGNRFYVDAFVALTNKGSSVGSATITGLPGTVTNLSSASMRIQNFAAAIDAVPLAVFNNGGSSILLQKIGNAATTITNFADTDFSNTTEIIIGGNFKVAS